LTNDKNRLFKDYKYAEEWSHEMTKLLPGNTGEENVVTEIHQCPLCGGELQRLDQAAPGMRAKLIGEAVESEPRKVAASQEFFRDYQASGYFRCQEVTCRHEGSLVQLERRAHSLREGHRITPAALLGLPVDAEVWAVFHESCRRPPGGKGGGGGSKGRKKNERGGLKLVGNEPWDPKHAEEKTTTMLRGARTELLALPGVNVTADHARRIFAAYFSGELKDLS
jgi:hypothetical protein